MVVGPLSHLAWPLPHHHVLSTSTLTPSCTKNKSFDYHFPLKTSFIASYATVYKTAAYVRSFGWFFRIWPTLYAEKTSIPAWAETHNLGWPRKLNGQCKLKKIAWNRKRRTWEVTWIKQCRISSDDAPRIHVESFELKWVKISNGMEFLNFLLFIEFFWNFLPTFYSFDHFWPFSTVLN